MDTVIVNYLHLGQGEEVRVVKYLGGNVYLLETDSSTYLVKREGRGILGDVLKIFQHEVSVARSP
jgi:hypothetical protein